MTTDDRAELDGFERERRAADERYNDALTALDRAVVAAEGRELVRDDFDRVATALVVFLQQITAFVESKDRVVAQEARGRLDTVEQTLGAIAELRAQMGILQRATEMLRRGTNLRSTIPNLQSAVPNPQSAVRDPQYDYQYVGFEDQFRGSDAAIQDRLRAYLPIFEGRSNVLDLGCGRGEFLAALKTAGIAARGIDANTEMVASARERGLDASEADALAFVMSLPDGSLGGLVATQVIEHLEPSYLMRLLDQAARALAPGAPIVLETINPACWLAFFSSYLRDFTHVRPVHPETLQYLLRANGFERVEVRYSAPVPEHMKMKTIDVPADVLGSPDASAKAIAQLAHTVNANAVILNNLMFSHMDYAAVAFRV